MLEMKKGVLVYLVAGLFLLLLINSAYLAAFASPSIFYMGNVLFHVYAGVALAVCFAWLLIRNPELRRGMLPAAATFAVSFALGIILATYGNLRADRWTLWVHIAAGLAGVAALLVYSHKRAAHGDGWRRFERILQATVAAGLLFVAAGRLLDPFHATYASIANPFVTPASMEEEGGGPQSPFWPSSAKTNVGGLIPSGFFLESEKCGECHKDIYEQWRASAHHFSSFNNQFYRRSIEHMQELSGTKGSRWCASCHDHAMFFNGRFDKPAIEQIDTPEAQAGLGCVSCHSIVHVEGSMGNGGFTMQYPALHDLASSDNPYIRRLDRFLTFTDPEPHRRTFLKPFMKDSSEFCSTCHKVHLDIPVNNYRWIRGFNDYDNWQASGVSGQGARSFYYPEKPLTCGGCHMPLVPSNDPGNRDGMVHSHRFPAANTALAHVNHEKAWMKDTVDFLKSGFITVDIFAAAPADDPPGLAMMRRSGEGPQLASTFAVGEEAEQARQVVIREVGAVSAPVDKAGAVFKPGSKVKLDVVVRTRKIGHFFPGGTVDSFDVWLEVQARDATGRVIFWSGKVEDDGKGPVEPGAHFYRAFLLDGAGNPIDKRNAWQARSVLYVRLIPPGAADVAHYRLDIPSDAKGPITVTAKLQHRKFSHFYNQYSYAGQSEPGQPKELANLEHDSRKYSFVKANVPKNVSGKIKGEIPVLPIVTMAEATTTLQVGDAKTKTVWQPVVHKKDRERWNDWGIGMLLQGDLKGAEYAFKKVTEAEPGYADGWLNVARALIQEGETEAAKPYVQKALSINPKLARIYFFKALIEKADGDYDPALKSLETAASMYPRDRVVLNEIGRIRFLKRDYTGAVEALRRVIEVDPEDLQAHYTLMLAYRGLGDKEKAAREQKLFLRFKADEASQAITARRRMISPEDNNERQMIHDHVSAPLGSPPPAPPPLVSRVAHVEGGVD
jgi:tetratricopeptide (TPR) repeat protein